MSWKEYLAEDRRLAILRILEQQRKANDSVLHAALDRLGHKCSRDVVRGDMAWLDEQSLIRRELIGDGRVHVAELTQRGQDVALGNTEHPGVKRPSPG